MALAGRARRAVTFSASGQDADLMARDAVPGPFDIAFTAIARSGEARRIRLAQPGRHNIANALAAMAASISAGVTFEEAAAAIEGYQGVKRRFERIGEAAGVTVIDDFAHNPDKIAATLMTLRDFPGRLIVMFQPHGFGPLAKMRRELADSFADNLGADDLLFMPEPVYYGGTATRTVSSDDLAADIRARGRRATACPTREACGAAIVEAARAGDRVIVMGARDDTLPAFAESLVAALASR